ncbi:hypothetical protein TNIN_381561 [Trichonephila inaurata madagascariensis]|uniref:Uncharacterized protein n=1 Tax=Trichonephila inaurata madagascariensis TaxID=2747483 RepID=A0A8X6XNF0_9ARAC|nr:hypothetical protein TNIN_381561 [Trichonephila inaurata madagascariensis]
MQGDSLPVRQICRGREHKDDSEWHRVAELEMPSAETKMNRSKEDKNRSSTLLTKSSNKIPLELMILRHLPLQALYLVWTLLIC